MLISLVLPDGRALTGGVREVIRQVLDDPALRCGRPERWLGPSAIRARLRRIPGYGGGNYAIRGDRAFVEAVTRAGLVEEELSRR